MKIFAVYAIVRLKEKTDWVDEFRKKYDDPYEVHITLKQPCFIEEEIDTLKKKINNFFDQKLLKKIDLEFKKPKLDPPTKNNGCIMLKAEEQKELADLQKDIVNHLSEYNNYRKERTKAFEENFEPHITIGRHLDEKDFDSACKELPGNIDLKAEINRIVLAVVPEITAEEATNPKNLTAYKLI